MVLMDQKFLSPYKPEETEERIYQFWLDPDNSGDEKRAGFFNPDICIEKGFTESEAPTFAIVLPPPNVTGVLHMGHAAMLAIEDIIIRHNRMRGKRTLWLPGTDHAAIATQSKVEKLLEKEKTNRHDLGREEFLKRVDAYAQESHDTIVRQVRKMGASVDWSREAFTLDEKRNLAVRTAFKRMYDDDLIYRGYRVVNWDPKGQTVISDDETVYEERRAKLYTFKYAKDFPIPISTTRPETKVGDTAVAVHPDDIRYKAFIGKEYDAIFCGVPIHIKIIADQSVEKDFGTGALGVTPAHSAIDWDIAQRHNLPLVQVINEYAKMMVGDERLKGKKVGEAREVIVEWLRTEGLLEKEEEVTQNVSTAERTGGIIEPMPKLQWFIAVNKEFTLKHSHIKGISDGATVTLKQLMRTVVEDGETTILPDRFEKIYFQWIDNLRDWCISRQIWYGHRVPVYFDILDKENAEGVLGFNLGSEIILNKEQLDKLHRLTIKDYIVSKEVNGRNGFYHVGTLSFDQARLLIEWGNISLEKILNISKRIDVSRAKNPIVAIDSSEIPLSAVQDPDTLDTWFSSGLWTFSTLGWPDENAPDLQTYHPTQLLETGYDILFFWVARMILMSTYHLGQIPFEKVYLHGLVRDAQGKKMSKSLGNIIDPLDMIEKYGADATRLSLIIGAGPGADLNLSEDKIRGYKKYTNKLWNIARFILSSTPDVDTTGRPPLSPANEIIVKEFQETAAYVDQHMTEYKLHLAAERLYHYTWHTFADVILEEKKAVLMGDDQKARSEAEWLLRFILENLLKLHHPFIPYITEDIWQSLPKGKERPLIVTPWPIS